MIYTRNSRYDKGSKWAHILNDEYRNIYKLYIGSKTEKYKVLAFTKTFLPQLKQMSFNKPAYTDAFKIKCHNLDECFEYPNAVLPSILQNIVTLD